MRMTKCVVEFDPDFDENIKAIDRDPDDTSDLVGPGQSLLGAKAVIWTTTPWTIPSNKAVAFNPSISYGLYEVTGRPEECWCNVGDTFCWPIL